MLARDYYLSGRISPRARQSSKAVPLHFGRLSLHAASNAARAASAARIAANRCSTRSLLRRPKLAGWGWLRAERPAIEMFFKSRFVLWISRGQIRLDIKKYNDFKCLMKFSQPSLFLGRHDHRLFSRHGDPLLAQPQQSRLFGR
jgi:hypothetical protein